MRARVCIYICMYVCIYIYYIQSVYKERWGGVFLCKARGKRLGLPMLVCVECLPADKPWDVVSATRQSSGVAPRAYVRVYARVLVPPNLYIHAYIDKSRVLGFARPSVIGLNGERQREIPEGKLFAKETDSRGRTVAEG